MLNDSLSGILIAALLAFLAFGIGVLIAKHQAADPIELDGGPVHSDVFTVTLPDGTQCAILEGPSGRAGITCNWRQR